MAVVTGQSHATGATSAEGEVTIRGRWYALALFVLAYGLNNLDKVVIAVLVAPLKLEFGMSDSQISLLSGLAITVPYALGCIPIGMLGDRFNRKWLLVLIITCWSLATVGAGFATSIALLFLARVCVGLFEAGFSPMTLSLIGDFFPQRLRSTAFGLFALGAPIGVCSAMAIGAIIAVDYGWRAAFMIAGIPGIVIAVIIAFAIREPVRGVSDGKSTVSHDTAPSLWAVMRYIVANRPLFNLVLGMALSGTLIAALAVWLPTLFTRVHHLDGKTAGFVAAMILGVCGAFGAALTGFASDRIGGSDSRRLILVTLSILAAAACALTALFAPVGVNVTIALLAFCAFLAQAMYGTGYGLVTSMTPPIMRSTTLSIMFVSFNVVSYGGGALIVGFVSDQAAPHVGANSVAFGIGATALTSVLGALFILRAAALRRRAG